MRHENREAASNDGRPLHSPHSAVAANYADKRDEWMRQGLNLTRHHYVPRLATFMPTIGDCPVKLDKLDDKRRTYAVKSQQGSTIDRIDNWRNEESRYQHPFEYDSDGDSSD
eukprot:5735512-Pyramimonas_sp.AAC.1